MAGISELGWAIRVVDLGPGWGAMAAALSGAIVGVLGSGGVAVVAERSRMGRELQREQWRAAWEAEREVERAEREEARVAEERAIAHGRVFREECRSVAVASTSFSSRADFARRQYDKAMASGQRAEIGGVGEEWPWLTELDTALKELVGAVEMACLGAPGYLWTAGTGLVAAARELLGELVKEGDAYNVARNDYAKDRAEWARVAGRVLEWMEGGGSYRPGEAEGGEKAVTVGGP